MASVPPADQTTMTDTDGTIASGGYFIFRPERVRFLDIFRILFTRRTLADYAFVERSSNQTASGPLDLKSKFVITIVLAVQMALKASSGALSSIGRAIELLLNLPSFNGGTLGLIWRLLTGSVVWPSREAKEFRSLIAYINGRDNVGSTDVPLPTGDDCRPIEFLHLTILAASKAYDNEANIKDVVNNQWKMHFVEFFNCWNKFLGKKATQAFIFCDKEKDASLICVAFRGTEVFDAADWKTDLNFSYISMGGWNGRVHLGFMKALGLQDEKDFAKGFPKEEPAAEGPQGGDKPLAYYAIRQKLADLLELHPKATILVTGHSLGGALAALFPALLHLHGQEAILKKMKVVTHAQPRVGDGFFSRFLTKSAIGDHNFLRTVYRYDMVPRVPPTFPLLMNTFSHFGRCVYYRHWHDYQEMEKDEVPNWNYFNPIYNAQMYWSAWVDLCWAVILWEGIVSVMYRLVGILIPVVGPGIASHSTRNYVNGAAWANRKSKEKAV